jgi:calcineurin-like phosphoesterase family protein
MHCYRIELPLGTAEWKVKDKCREIASVQETGVTGSSPLLMPFPPFHLKKGVSEADLRRAIEESLHGMQYLSCMLEGWSREKNPNGYTLGFSVRLSSTSRQWQSHFSSMLCSYADLPDGKRSGAGENRFTIPVLSSLTKRRTLELWQDLGEELGCIDRILLRFLWRRNGKRKPFVRPVYLPVDLLRIRILRGNDAALEYDLPSQQWLIGSAGRDRERWEETLRDYRVITGKEIRQPAFSPKREVYVMSDLHLGHSDLIKYCARPFAAWDGSEMDKVLIGNWNNTVKPEDHVFFLGDLSYNGKRALVRNYITCLDGRISCIRGNHDDNMTNAADHQILVYRGIRFYLVHNPRNAPDNFRGWVIHGHAHNSNLQKYPFIDFENRRINVSAEVIGYRPISLSSITTLIQKQDAVENAYCIIDSSF